MAYLAISAAQGQGIVDFKAVAAQGAGGSGFGVLQRVGCFGIAQVAVFGKARQVVIFI